MDSGKWDEKSRLYEGDIRKVSAEIIPNFDFLVGGFPCQGFSIAGKRKGMSGEDTKGSEFYEIYRIAKVRQPQLLLLENVPGLFSSRGGEDFCTILRSLDEIGYDVEWDCINTSIFLPQNRERVFIVGHLRGKGGQKVFPIEEAMRKGNESSKRQTIGCITAGQGRIQNHNTFLLHNKYGGSKEKRGDIRRLTPTECERLQGFPDGWTEGISDSQRYKCLGNAVTTNVITEIGKKILKIF